VRGIPAADNLESLERDGNGRNILRVSSAN
jgi:hypothetical protein